MIEKTEFILLKKLVGLDVNPETKNGYSKKQKDNISSKINLLLDYFQVLEIMLDMTPEDKDRKDCLKKMWHLVN